MDRDGGRLYLPTGDGYRFEKRYPCASLSVGGIELSDYSAGKGLEKLNAAVLSLTGAPMSGKSGKSVSFREDPDGGDLVCGAELTSDGGLELTAGPGGTPEDAAAVFAAWLKQKTGFDPEKTGQNLSLDASDLPVRLTEQDTAGLFEPVFLYVSPLGDDGAEGTEDRPLRTTDGARLRVRELLGSAPGGITVLFGEGDYVLDAGIRFDAVGRIGEEAPDVRFSLRGMDE